MRLSKLMKNLALRSNADVLFDSVKKSKEDKVILDFQDIKFMSRSFCQQYLLRKKECKKKIEEINIADDVAKMFDTVKNQRSESQFNAKDFEIIEVPSQYLKRKAILN